MQFLKRLRQMLMVSLILFLGCSDGGWFVENPHGQSVAAALDIASCDLLAAQEFSRQALDEQSTYQAAMRAGKIIALNNGTSIEQGQALDFPEGHLVPYTDTGPYDGAEQARRRIGVYEWARVTDGSYRGQTVCIPVSSLRGKYSPL
jgi:hypothetical protein